MSCLSDESKIQSRFIGTHITIFSQSTVKANTNTDFENIVSQELVWEKDLGEGYITTSPLIHDDSIIVRTSGTWFDESRPMVYSFDFDGNLQWSITGEEARIMT